MAKPIKTIVAGIVGTVGGVIGLVIVGDIVGSETYNPANNETGTFEQGQVETTVLQYLIPLLALSLVGTAIGIWKF